MDEVKDNSEDQAERKVQCDECGRLFKTTSALISHKKFHSKTNVKQESKVIESVPEEISASIIEPQQSLSLHVASPEHEPRPQPDSPSALNTVLIRKLPNYSALKLPNVARATPGSAGFDLYAALDQRRCLGVNERAPIATGIALELPTNMVGKVVPRSGLALNKGITILNTPGIIDSDYRGEITVILINHSSTKFWIEPGTRIAQILFEPIVTPHIVYVDILSATNRGAGGFGSTGNF